MVLASQPARFSLHSANVMKSASPARALPSRSFSRFAWVTVACLFPLALALAAATTASPPGNTAGTIAGASAEWSEVFQSEQNITNSLGMVLIWIPAGYRVAQHEVTQAEYQKIHEDNPSRFKGASLPVEQVSWNQAMEFCRKLTETERANGLLPDDYSYALPTQAQWRFYVGDAGLESAITSHLGDRRQTEPVGSLPPNLYGLHDVRGNVWEWCSEPVARGASWRSHEDYLGLDFRFVARPDSVYDDIGFRVILQPIAAATNP
jgi:formylglycine-generating enzyme required for sulfatase activity